jgi:autotransporter-associated beta strand protein
MSFQVGNATTGTATITGALDMSNSSVVKIRSDQTNGQSGILSVGSLVSTSTTAVVQVNANSSNSTTGVLALNNASGTATYAGILQNGGSGTAVNTLSVTKAGAGTQVFSGASNTYTGTTTLNAGTLLINGTQSGGGAYTVNSGGTLGGTGSIGLAASTNASVLSGGKLQASSTDSLAFTLSGTGVLDVSGAMGGTASMFFTLDAPASTVIALSGGGLNIGSGVLNFDDFSFTAAAGFGAGTYTLFGGATALTGTLGTNLTGTISGLSSTISLSGNNVILTAVPEPATWALLAASLTVVVTLRRRHIFAAIRRS